MQKNHYLVSFVMKNLNYLKTMPPMKNVLIINILKEKILNPKQFILFCEKKKCYR